MAPIGAWADARPSRSDELGLLVGSEEQVHRRVAPAKTGPVRLAHGAAGQDDAQTRVRRLQPRELTLPADHLLLGALADRAGVDDDQVGGFHAGRFLAAGREQPPGHLLRVAAVHLAAEGPDVEARQGAGLRQVLREAPVVRGRRPAWRVRTRIHDVEHRQLAAWRWRLDHGRVMVRRRLRGSALAAARGRPRAAPTARVGLGVRPGVAVVVAATRRDQSELAPRRPRRPATTIRSNER